MNEKNIFSERFRKLINESNYSYEEIAQALGLHSKGTISKYSSGKIKNINISMIMKISTFFNISPAWLMGFTDNKYHSIKEKEQKPKIYEEICQGINTKKEILKNEDKYLLIKILEDTMNPFFIKNDTIIIKKQKNFKNGDLVVIKIEDKKLLIRKAWKNNENIILQSVSTNHEPIILTKKELQTTKIEIVGIVKELRRKFEDHIKNSKETGD